MLKVTIEDEEESRTIKCKSVIATSMGNTIENQIPIIKTIAEGDFSLQEIMQLLASMTVEVYDTMKEQTNCNISMDDFISSIKTIIDESIRTDEVI